MKFKKIVGFGDSWMWGDELLDPKLAVDPHACAVQYENTSYRESRCFLGQLGEHYAVPIENFGIPGGSLQSTIWNYIWWTQNTKDFIDQCLILVCHTTAWRHSWYNPNHISYENDPPWNRYVHGSWIISGATCYDPMWIKSVKSITALTACHELHTLNYLQSTMFFEGQGALYKNNLLQFSSAKTPILSQAQNLVWPNKSLADIIDSQPNSTNLLAKNGHPNELGHELIAQLLINHIDSCIIKG